MRYVRRTGAALPLVAFGLGLVPACAQVLGIPDDPVLVSATTQSPEPLGTNAEAPSEPPMATPGAQLAPARDEPPVLLPGAVRDGANADGVLPSEIVTRTEAADPELAAPVSRAPEPPLVPDAGAPDATIDAVPNAVPNAVPDAIAEGARGVGCDGNVARVPIDVVFILDNSASMAAEDAAFEAALPRFVDRLAADAVDQRVILLSSHRRAERGDSAEASTSVCIAAPISGLGACPSERPALGPRFFHYGIEIDTADSLERTLTAFSEPDPFGLTRVGWSEWLRPGASKVFIEISDADSSLPSAEFTSALTAAAPEQFSVDAQPSFVFHSIIGVAQKFLALDLYAADEQIQLASCAGRDAAAVGQVYQELSRTTGGLRQSICPVDALGLRLQVLAADVARRSFVPCSAGG